MYKATAQVPNYRALSQRLTLPAKLPDGTGRLQLWVLCIPSTVANLSRSGKDFILPAFAFLYPSFLHADSEDSDQTGRMPRLIWVFAGRTVILLGLSWGGSYDFVTVMSQTSLWKYHNFHSILWYHKNHCVISNNSRLCQPFVMIFMIAKLNLGYHDVAKSFEIKYI